jgi:hypothetical protein
MRMEATVELWTGKNRTFLALACALGRCAENSNVSFGVCRTCNARRLAGQFLIEVSNNIAADAAELSFVGLEVACKCDTA